MNAACTVLGLDFGTRRIGVAVGNTATGTATALDVIACRRGKPDWPRLEALVREWQPARLVLGLPGTDDGAPHVLAAAVTRFARTLELRFRLPVETIDERLSSWEADRRSPGGQGTDAVAAQIILETWLNQQGAT